MIARHLIIHGRVQGVFYRDWTVETARSLGVRGWVHNLPDGTVEARVEGEPHAVERMVAALEDGPPRSRVERTEQRAVESEGFENFERR